MAAIYTTPRTWTAAELVTASIMNTHVRDNLDYLKARPVARFADLDGTVLSTTSTSFVDVTGASVSITTSGSSRLLIMTSGSVQSTGATSACYFTLVVDGTNQGDASLGVQGVQAITGTDTPFSSVFITSAAVSDGAHTVKVQFRTTGGVTSAVRQISFAVLEVF